MSLEALAWLERRLRPRHGWLGFGLLLAVVAVLATAVLDARWVPEDGVVVPAALLGFMLAAALGERRGPAWLAWALLGAYGLLIVAATLGQLWPPPALWGDAAALRAFWLENGAIFAERAAGWVTAVAVGGRSNETIVFALLLGLLVWFMAAYAGWQGARGGRPLPALLLIALALALNGAFSAAPLHWAAIFVGLAALATAVYHAATQEQAWGRRGVDYSTQIRIDLIGYGGGIALALLALALTLPQVSVQAAAQLLLDNEEAQAVEEALDRAFGGVQVQRDALPAPGAPGGSGVLPRSFLLGSGPELARFVMMTARVTAVDPPGAATTAARHWRGLSYAVYTGQGWTLGAEEAEPFSAGSLLGLPPAGPALILRQEVHWRYDNRAVRYGLGLMERLDQPGEAFFGAPGDLVRVQGGGPVRYVVESRLPAPDASALRLAVLAAVPEEIVNRYTNLPETVPPRVAALAREVTAGAATPYDQALALEAFLRQYPYDLGIPTPPPEVDVADFFLFELQRGYCDYYATAMAVLARTLGLPARLASGYAAAPPDEDGVQTIRQNMAHSWPEIYFAGIGWVAFEPTAVFESPHAAGLAVQPGAELPPGGATPAPIPPQEAAARPWPWPWIAAAAGLLAALAYGAWRWARRPRFPREGVARAYGRLQAAAARLGVPPVASQTPAEFDAALQARLARFDGRWENAAREGGGLGGRLAALFAQRQYGGKRDGDADEAERLWREARRPLWLLWGAGLLARMDRERGAKEQDDDRVV